VSDCTPRNTWLLRCTVLFKSISFKFSTIYSSLFFPILVLLQCFSIFLMCVLFEKFIIFLYTNSSFKLSNFLIRNSVLHFFASGELGKTCLMFYFLSTEDSFLCMFPSLYPLDSIILLPPKPPHFSHFWHTTEMTPMNSEVRSRDCLLSFIFLRVFNDTPIT
jgi:hypothetical protein